MNGHHPAILPGMELLWKGSIAANLAAVRERIDGCRGRGRRPRRRASTRRGQQDPSRRKRYARRCGRPSRLRREPRPGGAGEISGTARREFPDLALHLIGPLQTNKVRDAVACSM